MCNTFPSSDPGVFPTFVPPALAAHHQRAQHSLPVGRGLQPAARADKTVAPLRLDFDPNALHRRLFGRVALMRPRIPAQRAQNCATSHLSRPTAPPPLP